jgi:hypothetical protein
MYCWLKPQISTSSSWVRPFLSLMRRTFRPTNLRMSMRASQRDTNYKVYQLYYVSAIRAEKKWRILPPLLSTSGPAHVTGLSTLTS